MSITQETRRESNRKTDRETRYNMILAILKPGGGNDGAGGQRCVGL